MIAAVDRLAALSRRQLPLLIGLQRRMFMSKKIQMVVLDWAGTTVDYGSLAPLDTMTAIFEAEGLSLAPHEINAYMGMAKRDHIACLLTKAPGAEQWLAKAGHPASEGDIDALYGAFESQIEPAILGHARLIDGVAEMTAALRARGLAVASTTGYTRAMIEALLPIAADQGYAPDCVVTGDDVASSRPAPFMIYECMRQLNIYPADRVVKVGDTVLDIGEGKNAGALAIGVLEGSNLIGLSQATFEGLSKERQEALCNEAREKYLAAGADMVIQRIADLPAAIDTLNAQVGSR